MTDTSHPNETLSTIFSRSSYRGLFTGTRAAPRP